MSTSYSCKSSYVIGGNQSSCYRDGYRAISYLFPARSLWAIVLSIFTLTLAELFFSKKYRFCWGKVAIVVTNHCAPCKVLSKGTAMFMSIAREPGS